MTHGSTRGRGQEGGTPVALRRDAGTEHPVKQAALECRNTKNDFAAVAAAALRKIEV